MTGDGTRRRVRRLVQLDRSQDPWDTDPDLTPIEAEDDTAAQQWDEREWHSIYRPE